MRNERSLSAPVVLTGVGIHGGREVRIEIAPAPAHHGIVFTRTDLEGRPSVKIDHRQAQQRARQTVIRSGEAEIQTVEHFMAAASALGIDNLACSIDAPELPAAGGCALPWVEILEQGKPVELKAPRKTLRLDQTVVVEDGDAHIVAFPNKGGLKLSYTLDYPRGAPLPSQHVCFEIGADSFRDEIAPARTFCLESEAAQLRAAGFGLGADYQNTLVVGQQGVIDNELRFPDEFARHKVLDLVGDLGLLGADLEAHVVATKSGHATNVRLVKELAARMEELENRGLVQRETGLDIREIMKIIPHRYPFLFLDRVIALEGYQRAVAIKNVSFNEPQFQGHWPGQPIFPGVLQVEALAQLAGVLFLRRMENTGKVAVLMSIDNIKFRRPVVPGDQLRLECETINIRNTSGKVLGRGTVNGALTVEALLKFRLMDD
ncbi:MAG: UDP-3-O-[3-hydroxymyristoyl] N-acetylglucosamine deacetylase [Planctomycetes bacterium]|nr:UDP-3-O-[3-hydroxymyristoyl] N-acetylglucosamine deacetylase [Planctomycetota bacterium]